MANRLLLILGCCIFLASVKAEGIPNYQGTPIKKCIDCLCHAVSGCYSRYNCARYSVSYEYWLEAGGPRVNSGDPPKTMESYRKCMRNENCIVDTIVKYTDTAADLDCNCDENLDCKDRLAIHLFGKRCQNPEFGRIRAIRFNHCAAQVGVELMSAKEGKDDCEVEAV